MPYDQLRPYVASELHKEDNCSRGSGSADDGCKQENNDTDNDDDLPDDSINDSSKLHKSNVYFHLLQIVDLHITLNMPVMLIN